MVFAKIDEVLEDINQGKVVIVIDDEDRENEGDFVCAAEMVTPEIINFMTKHGRGLICMPCEGKRLKELGIPEMVADNTSAHNTAFHVSIGAKGKITTGISAKDRAVTIKAVIDPETRPEDISRPGHVFPLRASEGGVLKRAGHTEAAVDIATMSGLYPAGVICEIMNEDGTMARLPQLKKVALAHGLKIVTIADLIEYRHRTEKFIERVAEINLPTRYGDFRAFAYNCVLDGKAHLAIVKGDVDGKENVLVRVHSECLTGDVFKSLRCDCGDQFDEALQEIEKEGQGVFLYMSQEGRGIGLLNKLKAYELQERGKDTVEANLELGFPADLRDYGVGAQILVDLGLSSIRLMTNNPRKIVGIEGYGLKVVERVHLKVKAHQGNIEYLKTKKQKLNHLIHDDDLKVNKTSEDKEREDCHEDV